MAQSSTSELLMASIKDQPAMGKGKYNAVFEISDAAFSDYLLRAPLQKLTPHLGREHPTASLSAWLSSSSSLTPPSLLYMPRNIAQPLLAAPAPFWRKPAIQLIERQKGETLTDIKKRVNTNAGLAKDAAFGSEYVMRQLLADGPAALQPLFVDWYQLIRHNRKPASTHENIMYDPESGCHAIDAFDCTQLVPGRMVLPLAPHGDGVLKGFFENRLEHRSERFLKLFEAFLHDDNAFSNTEQRAQYEQTYQSFARLVRDARERAIAEVKYSGPAFAKIKDVSGVSLKDPSGNLLEGLDTMRAQRTRR